MYFIGCGAKAGRERMREKVEGVCERERREWRESWRGENRESRGCVCERERREWRERDGESIYIERESTSDLRLHSPGKGR